MQLGEVTPVNMKLIIVCLLVSTAMAAPAAQTLTFHDDGSYRFYYETGEGGGSHSRSEVRNPDGVVIGKFSYQDSDGEMREVNYRADEAGFVAEGDVGVKGAPKGRFPAIEDPPDTPSTAENLITTEAPTVKTSESTKQHDLQPKTNDAVDEAKDDLQELSLEEPAALDDPPEGFPPGFFLQKFQGLRRLPEPTKKPNTESPKSQPNTEVSTTTTSDEKKSTDQGTATVKVNLGEVLPEIYSGRWTDGTSTTVQPGKPNRFSPWNRFYGLSPSEWASAMYHQPVYVFSYQQPDSYGYHYFF